MSPPTTLVNDEAGLAAVAARFGRAARVALDIESNGLFAYRAKLCTVQLAIAPPDGPPEVAIVDPLTTPLAALGPLLASASVPKIVHDVSFDARILAEAGLTLANVLDTSIAARMLGRPATGLASLLASELGVVVDKKMQQHDWASRPLDRAALAYLANDVVHLDALAAKIWTDVAARDIADAIAEETRYRLQQAIASAGTEDPRPAYIRLKGIDKVPADELAILRGLAEIREEKARELDVPPYKVLAPDVLFAIARAKPKTQADLARIRGAMQGRRARSLAAGCLLAVAQGLSPQGAPPPEELALLVRPRLPASVAKERRAREQRLTKWRKHQAGLRAIDEQVVLPGHCLQDLADLRDLTLEAIAAVPGIGAFRVARDGEAFLRTLAGDEATA